MSVNSKFMVNFSLNEVKKYVNSIYKNLEAETAFKLLVEDIIPFYTTSVPYSIISDIAANILKFSGSDFSDKPLAKPINLGPSHVIDRVTKSLFLSEGRAAFGLGFFPGNELVGSVDDPQYEKYDEHYYGLKTLTRRGYESLARFLAFRYSRGLISLSIINRIAKYVSDKAREVDFCLLAMLIILATNNEKASEFKSIAKVVNSGVRKAYLDAREPGKLSYTDKDFASGITNFILLYESIITYMASDSSDEEKTSDNSNTILANYIEDLVYVGDEQKLKGLCTFYGDGYRQQEFEEIIDDIIKVMELE